MLEQLISLFWTFFRVGILAFGGGQSIIPVMQQEVVDSRQWMNVPEFTDMLALGNGLPGPIATKMALGIGYKISGILGAGAAMAGLILPSSVLMLIVVLFFFSYKESPHVQAMLRGMRPAVMALLFLVAYDIGKTSMISIPTTVIGVATFFIFLFTKLHPAIAILASGIIGLLFL
jgi:chromate transporter